MDLNEKRRTMEDVAKDLGILEQDRVVARLVPAEVASAVRAASLAYQRGSDSDKTAVSVAAATSRTCLSQRLVYNRVGKAGSTTMLALLEKLQGKNPNLLFKNAEDYHVRWTGDHGEAAYESMLSLMGWQKCSQAGSAVYVNHANFVDYNLLSQATTKAGGETCPPPIFMNMVRHPISLCVSNYYYSTLPTKWKRSKMDAKIFEAKIDINHCVAVNQKKEERKEGISEELYAHCLNNCLAVGHFYTFFCGFHEDCETRTEKSYARARKNIKEGYAVVGITERMDETVGVLEGLLPEFFAGATEDFAQLSSQRVTQNDEFYELPDAETMKYLSAKLLLDLELYDWLDRRFGEQHNQLTKGTLKPYTCGASVA